MDFLTQCYYEGNAIGLAPAYASAGSGIASWFDIAFPRGCRVLDVGASSGRDVDRLLKGGWDAFGVDPCEAFINEALSRYPHLEGRLSLDNLPRLLTLQDAAFEGILCAAVLMHLPEDQLRKSTRNLRRIIRPGGTLLTSLPVDAKGRPLREREFQGRLFNGLSPSRLDELLGDCGFVPVARGRSLDSMGRLGRQWVTQLFTLESEGISKG